jgi:hypothetical protein
VDPIAALRTDGPTPVSTGGRLDLFRLLQEFLVSNPVSDPGFETPWVGTGTYGSFRYDPSGSPWSFSGDAGVAGNGSGFTAGNPNAPQGTQVAFLQDTGSVSQSISLATGNYTVSFSAAQRGNFQASYQTIAVLIDGNLVGTFTPADTSYTAFTTMTFSVQAGVHDLSFVGLDPDGYDNSAFIDQLSINLV